MVSHTKKGFPQKSESVLIKTPEKIPLVKLTRWHYQHYSCAAYQLPNGELVMSARQAALPLWQSNKNAKTFFQTHKLDTIPVQLPNRKIISTYPLPAVAIYWRYLLESHLIPQGLTDKFD